MPLLKAQPDVAIRYMRAIVEGIYMVKNNREPSIRAMSKYLRIDDREALEDVYRLYKEIYPQIPHPSSAAIQTQLTWMADRDPRAKQAKPEQFFDGTICGLPRKERLVALLYRSSPDGNCYSLSLGWPRKAVGAALTAPTGCVDLPHISLLSLDPEL